MKSVISVIIGTVLFSSAAYADKFPFQHSEKYESKYGVLEVTPSNDENPKFGFLINANVDMYVCEATETAYITERDSYKNTWTATALVDTESAYNDNFCKIEFIKDKDGKITVKTNFGCAGFCGIGAEGAMDGIYKKVK